MHEAAFAVKEAATRARIIAESSAAYADGRSLPRKLPSLIYVMKNEFVSVPQDTLAEQPPQFVKSDPNIIDSFVSIFTHQLQLGNHLGRVDICLREAIINYAKHSNDFSPRQHVLVRSWLNRWRRVFAISGNGEGYVPDHIYITLDELYAHENTCMTTHQRGIPYMVMLSDFYAERVENERIGLQTILAFDMLRTLNGELL
jgi:hypothetical protein